MGTSKQIRQQRVLQESYLKVRRDLAATSSQDEFARWAKLRRQHDKMLEELEKMSASSPCIAHTYTHTLLHLARTDPRAPCTESGIDTTRASFDKTVTGIRWLSTSGARWILPMWYAREPMFWLPHGWFPYYAEWIISFPRAPLGSVSVASWQLACTVVVGLVSDTLGTTLRLVLDARAKHAARQREQPVKDTSRARTDTGDESKKEL